MALQRGSSQIEAAKEPHSVSLKVLRLSRPSLAVQHPLPVSSPPPLSSGDDELIYPPISASLAYPVPSSKEGGENNFILSPLLTLPPAFGSAYVGEMFSCTLCANNELPAPPRSPSPSSTSPPPAKSITNLRIYAEMKIPSATAPIPLPLSGGLRLPPPPSPLPPSTPLSLPPSSSAPLLSPSYIAPTHAAITPEAGIDLAAGGSLQKVIHFDLKEEGNHVLAVTVTYTESGPLSGRVRNFRKLYQFVCKSCMVVRTKTGLLPSSKGPAQEGEEGAGKRKWALEAQLENTGEETIVLDEITLDTRAGFTGMGLNWDIVRDGEGAIERPVLMPGDVEQVCFVIEEVDDESEEAQEMIDGRLIFGILNIGWKGQMGNRGFLSTGNLGIRVG